MAAWPASLPQSFLISGYSSEKRDARLITNVVGGRPKIRRLYTDVPSDDKGRLVLTKAQLDTLNSFYEDTLSGGTLEFDWSRPEEATIRSYRFKNPPTWSALSCDLYAVDIEVEVQP